MISRERLFVVSLGFFVVNAFPVAFATETIVTHYDGATQIWFRADGFDAKDGEVDTAPNAEAVTGVPMVPGSLTGSPMVFFGDASGNEDWWLEYRIQVPDAGTWYLYGRAAANSSVDSHGSHYLWVLGDPEDDDTISPPGTTPEYNVWDDRMFGDQFDPGKFVGPDRWAWVGEKLDPGTVVPEESRYGVEKEFQQGENVMRIYEREASPNSVQFEFLVLVNVDETQYMPTDLDLAKTYGLVLTSRRIEYPSADGIVSPGDTVDVSFAVENPSDENKDVTITDTFPEGWTAGEISHDGSESDGTITWAFSAEPGGTTVTYKVSVPDEPKGSGVWNGTIQVGSNEALEIPGDRLAGLILAGVGIFQHSMDIGDVGANGSASFDEGADVYLVEGSGADIGGSADACYFLFTELTGAFSIKGTVLVDPAESPEMVWIKGGIMIRNNPSPGASNVFGMINAEYGFQSQYRTVQHGGTDSGTLIDESSHMAMMELVRGGNKIDLYYWNEYDERVFYDSAVLNDLEDPVYVGLAITSYSVGDLSIATAERLELTLLPYSAVRSLPADALDPVIPGTTLSGITITLTIREGETEDITVTERPPANWPVSNVNTSAGEAAVNGVGELVWTLTGATGTQTLTYDLTLPSYALGGLIDGQAESDTHSVPLGEVGLIADVEIHFKQVNVENPEPVMLIDGEAFIEAEDGIMMKPPEDDTDSFDIRIEPKLRNQQYVNALYKSMEEITGHELDFVFEVTEPGTYRVIVNTRTPTTGSDSFYIGMDDDLGETTSAYCFRGSGFKDDDFHVTWLFVDGDRDKSWDLEAGIHKLRIHTRENNSQLDWIFITDNLDQDPAEFTPPPYEPPTEVSHYMLYH